MFNKLKELWIDASTNGIKLPFLHDPVSDRPSITLMSYYVALTIAWVSVVCLHFFPDILIATITSIIFWIVAVIFYMIRKLQKAKIDLDDKSIELDAGEDNK